MAAITATLIDGPCDGRVITMTEPHEAVFVPDDKPAPSFAFADIVKDLKKEKAPTKHEYRLSYRTDESSYFYKFAQ